MSARSRLLFYLCFTTVFVLALSADRASGWGTRRTMTKTEVEQAEYAEKLAAQQAVADAEKKKQKEQKELEKKAKAQAQAKADAEAKAKAEADVKAKSGAEAKAKLEAEAGAKAKAEAEAEAEAEVKMKSEADTKAKAAAEAKAKEEAAAKAKAQAKPAEKKIEKPAEQKTPAKPTEQKPAPTENKQPAKPAEIKPPPAPQKTEAPAPVKSQPVQTIPLPAAEPVKVAEQKPAAAPVVAVKPAVQQPISAPAAPIVAARPVASQPAARPASAIVADPVPKPAPQQQLSVGQPPVPPNFLEGRIIDMTYSMWPGMPLIPGAPAFVQNADALSMSEHSGTHVDAPAYTNKTQAAVDAIPPKALVARAYIVDVREQCLKNPDHAVSRKDMIIWESRHGAVPSGSVVFLLTGWGAKWADPPAYLNKDAAGVMHFPGLAGDAAKFLVQERNVRGVGTDALTVDPGNARTGEAHREIHALGRYTVENVRNIEMLPPTGATVVIAPIKVASGAGAPARVLAFVP